MTHECSEENSSVVSKSSNSSTWENQFVKGGRHEQIPIPLVEQKYLTFLSIVLLDGWVTTILFIYGNILGSNTEPVQQNDNRNGQVLPPPPRTVRETGRWNGWFILFFFTLNWYVLLLIISHIAFCNFS